MSQAKSFDRVILIVLDSVGVGAAKDAQRFGDESSNTLQHISEWANKSNFNFSIPHLSSWGLGHLVQAPLGITAASKPVAAYGVLSEISPGKDTTTGHWEMAGNLLPAEFPVFPHGFSKDILEQWCAENKLSGWLCNKPSSGTTVLDDFGEEHLRTLKPIVYTSADSVFQIACSEEAFGLERLYQISKSARKLIDPLGVGRVIARPFIGQKKGAFKRTENRRDFSVPPPSPNMLDILIANGHFVAGVGKIEDIFAHRSVSIVEHTGRNETSCEATLKVMRDTSSKKGLVFTNLIDFDQLHGHRRNPKTYAEALMAFDAWLPSLMQLSTENDLIILTADHGNDPTHSGTDHTRENVPLLTWSKRKGFAPGALGQMKGFATVARLTLEALGLGTEVAKLDGAKLSPSLIAKIGVA